MIHGVRHRAQPAHRAHPTHRAQPTRILASASITLATAVALAACSGTSSDAPAPSGSFEARAVAVVAPVAQWREQGADDAAQVLATTGLEGLLTADNYAAQVEAGCPDQQLPADEAGWVCDATASTAYLVFPAALTSGDVSAAAATEGGGGDWQVHVELTETGASKLAALTADAAQSQPQGAVAFVVDGEVFSAPVVMQAITGGPLVLAGGWNEAEAKAAADAVSNGA